MSNKIADFFGRIGQFLKEVKVELQKVSWLSKEELRDSTIIVLASTLVLSIVVAVFDFIMSKIISMVL
jgi:preprotein translocase subunit SecE